MTDEPKKTGDAPETAPVGKARVILPKVQPKGAHIHGGPPAPKGRGSKGHAQTKPGVARLPGRNG